MGDTDTFLALRPSLFGLAYRMLGSATEAEDVLQEAYLRWSMSTGGQVTSPRGYLTTIVTRLCIDVLRSARVKREAYKGPWLPEPVETGRPDPADQAELADSLSLAFLVLLEELQPVERAAFLLHEVFEYPYDEVARVVDRNETSCRQLVSRARRRIDARRHRFDADEGHGREMTRRFVQACATGDIEALKCLLAEDVVVWTDGGGQVRAALRPVIGPHRAARFLTSVARRVPPGASIREVTLNGQPSVVLEDEGQVTIALTVDVLGDQVIGVRVVTNPDKLTALQPGHQPELGGR